MLFVFKVLSFLLGYVNILVRGEALEKFVNMAASRGIYLWDITRVEEDKILVKVRLSAVRPLRHIARKTRCRFFIRNREGLPFLMARLQRRKTLAVGAIIFLATLYILSSFVWFIDVKGNRALGTREILQAAEKAGLARGIPKWRFAASEVEKAIREQLPAVSWTGVYIKGTRVIIEIAEKTVPDNQRTHQGPVHIVARKAGLIEEVLVLTGHPAVKDGDTVVEGQVLISGEIPPPEEELQLPQIETPPGEEAEQQPEAVPGPTYVHANGIVRARIWYEDYGEAPVVEKGQRQTGNTVTRLCMKIGAKEIILTGPKEIPFIHYKTETNVKRPPQWRNIKLPVELITVKYLELENYREERGRDGARRLAEKRALASVEKKLPREARVLQRRIEEVNVGKPEQLVRVKVFLETLEEIGAEKPFKPGENIQLPTPQPNVNPEQIPEQNSSGTPVPPQQ